MRTEILRAIALGGMVFVLALRRAERRVVERLLLAGARATDSAAELGALGSIQRLAVRRLVWGRAVGLAGAATAEGGAYFLDPAGYLAFRRRRRVRALVVLGLVLVAAGVWWWRVW